MPGMQEFGIPSTGGNAPHQLKVPGGKGYFAVPTGIQRLYEYGLYSSARFPAGTNISGLGTIRLFGYGQTNNGPGFGAVVSSISETNVRVGGMAPGDETYEVSAIAIEIYGEGNVAPLIGDVRTLLRLGVAFWEFGNTTILPISPISMIGAGGGIFGMTADTGTPVTQANNGNGGLWLYQNCVVCVPATQSWSVQLQWGTAALAAGLAANTTVVNATHLRATLFNQARIAVPIA